VDWIDNRGFLNKVTDATTGLTDVGARWYDPTLGRFVSLDRVLETDDNLALGGYAYTDGNPITYEDPSGLMFEGGGSDDNRSTGCGSPGFIGPCPVTDTGSSGSSGTSSTTIGCTVLQCGSTASSTGDGLDYGARTHSVAHHLADSTSTHRNEQASKSYHHSLCGSNSAGYITCSGPIGNTNCPAGFAYSVSSCFPTFTVKDEGPCAFGHNSNGSCNGDGVESYIKQHFYVQASFCAIACASLNVEDGQVSFEASWPSFSTPSDTLLDSLKGFGGVQVGWNARSASESSNGYFGGCAGDFVAGCLGATSETTGSIDDSGANIEPYASVGVGWGISGGAGATWSKTLFNY
jgi:RHS repeat-associated protein